MSRKVRRCAIVLIEPREQPEFDLDDLLRGGGGVRVVPQLVALAPHLDEPVPIDAAEAALLQRVRASDWHAADELDDDGALASLVAKGLVFGDDAPADPRRERDEKLRARHWYPHAAVLHYFGRWSDVDAERNTDLIGLRRQSDLVAKFGPPPPAVCERASAARTALARGTVPDLDGVLRRRVTCRNFAREVPLPRAAFEAVLDSALAARAVHAVGADPILKKSSPSGGGLHPIEAYVLVRNVEGVAPGFYHYHPVAHALDALAGPVADDALATRLVAGQRYFADAHAMVALVARFERSFWKYRNHSKAYRVLALEAGHVSQTIYLCATALGLGAFVTAAVNELEIERAFGLDPLDESPLAMCGFGVRAAVRERVEFDPNREVWKD